ncbi:hypothetical protein CSE16_10785 [Solibacillus sp. R5-41]|uniref:helix-turn-helix domain-containing protein n=1 Tax=Solibacillus sp. R5-41 TaxID=2048654 RepID=UPI000C1246A3|nr:helix-turn-helix domain-containing protein [Solibacillus sp. R5-41]ATP40494.1 hypothetical protein CSE16_10785 [Solibacillus sp. R5-41]
MGIVLEYIEGRLSYHALARKYGIPSKSLILQWVRTFKELGEVGLLSKYTKQVYSV